jgi:hypothetical protein
MLPLHPISSIDCCFMHQQWVIAAAAGTRLLALRVGLLGPYALQQSGQNSKHQLLH